MKMKTQLIKKGKWNGQIKTGTAREWNIIQR